MRRCVASFGFPGRIIPLDYVHSSSSSSALPARGAPLTASALTVFFERVVVDLFAGAVFITGTRSRLENIKTVHILLQYQYSEYA